MNIIVGLALCIGLAWQANNKGYNPFLWFLAGGPLGWLIMATLPDLKKSQLPVEEIVKKRRLGNGIAIVFSGVMVVLLIFIAISSSSS